MLAAAVGLIDKIEGWTQPFFVKWLGLATPPDDLSMIFGFPSWIVGLVLLFALLWWWTLEYAVRIRKKLKPKFSVTYKNDHSSYRKAINLTADQGKTLTNGISIRMQIDCLSDTSIDQCSGFLTKVEFKPPGGTFSEIPIYEPNRLPWALEEDEFAPVAVFPNVPKYLGICSAREQKKAFLFRTNVKSLAAPNEFRNVGEYRFYIEVVAQHCASVSKVLLIGWNGIWDEITACLVGKT